jgi:hypothetical protein
MKDHEDLINRIADAICTVVIAASVLYFGGGVIAAWLRGAFQAVTR